MRKLLTSKTWNWVTLAVGLVAMLSVGSLIYDVTALQRQFEYHAGWVRGLKELDRSVWDLQVAALRPNSEKGEWIRAESAFRGQVERLNKRVEGDRTLTTLLTEVER
ncbi:MAG: hypothetical protein H7X97_14420, partial [Opitutaceae bacterium]|nr:hypothetical protein [Verrucomicrobiales bacterium]